MKRVLVFLAVAWLGGCASVPDRMEVDSGYFGKMAVNSNAVSIKDGMVKFRVEGKHEMLEEGASVNCYTGEIELAIDFVGAKLPVPLGNPAAKNAIYPLADYACLVATGDGIRQKSVASLGYGALVNTLRDDYYQMQALQEQHKQTEIMQQQLNYQKYHW